MQSTLENILTFINMGGYAGFIWSAYGVMILIFYFNIAYPRRRHCKIKAKLRSES